MASVTHELSTPRATTARVTVSSQLRTAARVFLALTVLTGLVYPLAVTVVAKVAFSDRAEGSLVRRDGRVVGSRLVGQAFTGPTYFWGRPSATSPAAYNATGGAASNLGPTNEALTSAARERVEAIRAAHPDEKGLVPVDLVTTSASGLDPHISPAAAEYQVARVARARGLPAARVRALVTQATTSPTLLGEAVVDVLALNLSLDAER